jgi:hypothetical protein
MFACFAFVMLVSALPAADSVGPATAPTLPAGWLSAWAQPAPADRPLQMLHALDPKRANPEGMKFYRDLGLGGIVSNVNFHDYLVSEKNWQTLIAGVDACAKLGLIVWLYDEKGYPSGSAGGLVLQENRAWEAMELAFDAQRSDPFLLRPAYEFTHASNNHHEARRYINLIDDRAVGAFLAKTHDAYWRRLQTHFGHTIQATFTDEPSLIAVNLGTIPEQIRRTVPTKDPLDPSVTALPCVPWAYDLAQQYRQRYGEDLAPQRRSLFGGDTDADRKIRRQYWALIADLVNQRYFGRIHAWCAAHGLASSGHCLSEEQPMLHVPLNGNTLQSLQTMDIPGMDMLSSNPEIVRTSGWLTAALPSSAALLQGRRRVMSEMSDYSQRTSSHPAAALAEMQAAAAWQAAWGVTDFRLYYRIDDRTADDYRAYCQFVGRLNAVLRPAAFDREVLLYYPIYDLWSEYLPRAERFSLAAQSPRGQRLVNSFQHAGRTLQRSQVPFALIDHDGLADAAVEADGVLKIHSQRFRAIVLPADVELPPRAAAVVKEFQRRGGRVVAAPSDETKRSAATLLAALQPAYRLDPPSEQITLGRFRRDGRAILLLVNVTTKPYRGTLATGSSGAWQRMNPCDGKVVPLAPPVAGRLGIAIAPYEAILLVGSR